jgi:hypothetical protein
MAVDLVMHLTYSSFFALNIVALKSFLLSNHYVAILRYCGMIEIHNANGACRNPEPVQLPGRYGRVSSTLVNMLELRDCTAF